jgi:SAM-dependent methyltransferase
VVSPEALCQDTAVDGESLHSRAASHPADATTPEVLGGQYASSANLMSRVSIYSYLEPAPNVPARWERWVLDHVDWTGSEAVADVGCGPGSSLGELSARAATTVALDLSVGMLREVRTRFGTKVPVAAADAQRLPLPDASLDVVLAAHMLYHLPDIGAGIGEFRRVLRPGGTLLVALNGAHDKAEIRALWKDAALAVSGSAFEPSHWGDRANLDNAGALLASNFSSVTIDRLPGMFRFPTPDPPMRWIDSLRPGTESRVGDAEWAAVAAEARRRIEEIIALDGEFTVRKDSGVVIGR